MASRPKENKHPLLEVTDAWRRSVDRALKQIGKSRKWLADEVGSPGSGITNILNGISEESTYVQPISEVLAVALPAYGSIETEKAVKNMIRLRDEDPKRFSEICEDLSRALLHASDNSPPDE